VQTVKEKDASDIADRVKLDWKVLWMSRIDDKVRAEGMANRDYTLLFVERGTVIVATRDFKPLNLREILEAHEVENIARVLPPPPSVGGYRKFARTVLKMQKRAQKWRASEPARKGHGNLQLKKGGRGWQHARLRNRD
jgi:hypothetical protein